MPRGIRLGRQGFAHFPFAKLEAVAQYESQRLFGRASGIAGKFVQAALLGRAKKRRGHGQLRVQLVYSYYHSRLCLSETLGYFPLPHPLDLRVGLDREQFRTGRVHAYPDPVDERGAEVLDAGETRDRLVRGRIDQRMIDAVVSVSPWIRIAGLPKASVCASNSCLNCA